MTARISTTPYVRATGQLPSIPVVVVQGQTVSTTTATIPSNNNNSNETLLYSHGGRGNNNHHTTINDTTRSDDNNYHPYNDVDDSMIPVATTTTSGIFRGVVQQQQPPPPLPNTLVCRDLFWAILFYIQLGCIAVLSIQYIPTLIQDTTITLSSSYNSNGNNNHKNRFLQQQEEDGGQQRDDGWGGDGSSNNSISNNNDSSGGEALWSSSSSSSSSSSETMSDWDTIPMMNMAWIVTIGTVVGMILSTIAMSIMMIYPRTLIKTALWCNIIVASGVVIISVVYGPFPLMPIVVLLLSTYTTTLFTALVVMSWSLWGRIDWKNHLLF
jgi:hypothetical protein